MVEFIGKFLKPQQRLYAGEQLFRENRFIQELVGACFDAADLVFAISQARDHHHRDQPRFLILLQFTAQFVAILARHDYVQQY